MEYPDLPTAAGGPRSYGFSAGVAGRPAGSAGDSAPQRAIALSVPVEVPPGNTKNRPPQREKKYREKA
eukprot:8604062-Lingulodinium_polyedra.AAC.1